MNTIGKLLRENWFGSLLKNIQTLSLLASSMNNYILYIILIKNNSNNGEKNDDLNKLINLQERIMKQFRLFYLYF